MPGRPTIWMIAGQGPIGFAVGVGGCLDIFTLLYLFSFSISLGDGPIWTEILSQRAVKLKTTMQPKFSVLNSFSLRLFVVSQVGYKKHGERCYLARATVLYL